MPFDKPTLEDVKVAARERKGGFKLKSFSSMGQPKMKLTASALAGLYQKQGIKPSLMSPARTLMPKPGLSIGTKPVLKALEWTRTEAEAMAKFETGEVTIELSSALQKSITAWAVDADSDLAEGKTGVYPCILGGDVTIHKNNGLLSGIWKSEEVYAEFDDISTVELAKNILGVYREPVNGIEALYKTAIEQSVVRTITEEADNILRAVRDPDITQSQRRSLLKHIGDLTSQLEALQKGCSSKKPVEKAAKPLDKLYEIPLDESPPPSKTQVRVKSGGEPKLCKTCRGKECECYSYLTKAEIGKTDDDGSFMIGFGDDWTHEDRLGFLRSRNFYPVRGR